MNKAALFALLLFLPACTGGDSGEKKLRFAFVPKMRDNPVFAYAKIAAEHRAQELGGIEIVWRAPNETDPVEQGQIVERLVGLGVDGIAISCNEAEPLRRPINRAVEAGVPVICFDADSPGSKRKYLYGTDDIACGRILGKELGRLLGGKGEVAILTGFSGADNLNRRVKGARDYLSEQHPDIKIVQTLYCDDDVKKAVDAIESYMQAKPNLAGWIVVGGWPTWGNNGLASIDPAKTKVVCFDGLPEQWSYLERGECQVLIAQNIWSWGTTSVDILKAIVDGKEYPGADENGYIASPTDVLTPENIPEYRKKWERWFGGGK